MSAQKIIAVIGATGAQGLPVVKHLLDSKDSSTSPWKVRALTRDPGHRRAKEMQAQGVELIEGSFLDMKAVERLFDGAYGAFVNTDSFTVGATAELETAFKIWEVARMKGVRHFVWSNLDYALKIGKSPIYNADHYNAKGRFGEFLGSQPSCLEQGSTWTLLSTGPYMELIKALLGPLNVRPDGTRVWATPMGKKGRYPLIALDDIGWWARYIFDHPTETAGKDVAIASEVISVPEIVETFTRVTGIPAECKELTMDEFFALWTGELPIATDVPDGMTWEENFRATFALWRDGIAQRDMEWISSIHPPTTLEKWIRENNYQGIPDPAFNTLKNVEDGAWQLRHHPEKTTLL